MRQLQVHAFPTVRRRRPNKNDLIFLKGLLEAGTVVPVIDRTYPLREVAKAIGYLEAGHAQGKVVITMEHTNKA